jgi:hypothetical protein
MNFIPGAANFKFQYLPDFASFLLNNKLDELVLTSIRFCRDADLPMMRPLSRMSEEVLVEGTRETNRAFLAALAVNDIEPLMEERIKQVVDNNFKDKEGNRYIDNSEIMSEDLILGFYLRRKVFIHFLHAYTKNLALHMLIVEELDYFTTYEHVATAKALLVVQNSNRKD